MLLWTWQRALLSLKYKIAQGTNWIPNDGRKLQLTSRVSAPKCFRRKRKQIENHLETISLKLMINKIALTSINNTNNLISIEIWTVFIYSRNYKMDYFFWYWVMRVHASVGFNNLILDAAIDHRFSVNASIAYIHTNRAPLYWPK